MSASSSPTTLNELFTEIQHLPFLFVGSGLSRRYRGLPDWNGLLSHFADKVHPDNPLALQVFTGGESNPDLPAVATAIEAEFNKIWLKDASYASERERHKELVRKGMSPFKIEVAAYFSRSKNITGDKTVEDELALLKNVAKRSVAGIITTNYDSLLESVFENYRTFVGQQPLLFGQTQGVAEIYKIHGCCSQPDSLVLNSNDYQDFEKRNAYLAAKLLTIFVEHPIVFLGYSLADKSIQSILAAIIYCLGPTNLNQLKQRLIFVEYTSEELTEPVISTHAIQFEGNSRALELTKVKMNGFLPLYRELQAKKYQYNPRLLRQIKRDIYHLATTNQKVDRFQVADIEDDAELAKVETLVGIGVIPDKAPTAYGPGHNIPEASQIFTDVVLKNEGFDVKSLVESALEALQKHHGSTLPICRYVGIYEEQFGEAPASLTAKMPTQLNDLLSNTLIKLKQSRPAVTVEKLLSDGQLADAKKLAQLPLASDLEGAVALLEPFLSKFMKENPDVLQSGAPGLKTDLRRVIRIYDFLKFGKEKGAHNTEEESIG